MSWLVPKVLLVVSDNSWDALVRRSNEVSAPPILLKFTLLTSSVLSSFHTCSKSIGWGIQDGEIPGPGAVTLWIIVQLILRKASLSNVPAASNVRVCMYQAVFGGEQRALNASCPHSCMIQFWLSAQRSHPAFTQSEIAFTSFHSVLKSSMLLKTSFQALSVLT